MKKRLIIVLSALLAVLLSLGLVACKETDDNNGGKTITDVTVTASPTIDENVTKDDWDKSGFTVKVTYNDGTTEDLTKVGEQFTIDDDDVKAIKFGTVGTYSVTIQPKENNPDFLTGTGAVVIDHVWKAGSEKDAAGNTINFEECTKDGARRTIIDGFKATVNIGAYWDSTNFVTPDAKCARIAQFPNVTLNGESKAVATATVGRLEEDMTISIRGTAKATSDANPWYFPILGIAVPELGNGGTGAVIRNDGWLLYDGVGTGGCLTGPGSNGSCPALSDMTDYSTWKDWAFYYEGTTSVTSDYAVDTDLELSWRFTTITDEGNHSVRVVELTFMNYTIGRSYVVRVKVPDSINAVQTIFHAEFFKMDVTKATVIEMKSLKNINSVAPTAGGKLAYVANEMFDFKALTVKADYKQAGKDAQVVSDYDLYGTSENVTDEAGAKAITDEAKWVNLKYNQLQSNFKYYRLKLTIGEASDVKYFAPTALGISVKANAVNDAIANQVTTSGNVTFPESGLNTIEFAQGTGVLPQLNISGYAATLTDAQKAALNNTTKKHYIAFSIYGRSDKAGLDDFTAATPSVTGTEGSVAVREFGQDPAERALHAVDVVLAVDSSLKSVTIKGVQTTDILVNFMDNSGDTPVLALQALNATSEIVSGSTLYLNKQSHLTIKYTGFGETIGTDNANKYQIGLGNAARALNYFFRAPGTVPGIGDLSQANNSITAAQEAGDYAAFASIFTNKNYAVRRLGTGVYAGISKADIKAGELTVHYIVMPDVASPKSYVAHFDTRTSTDAEFTYAARDIIYPELTLSAEGTDGYMANGVYVTASGMQVYLLFTGKEITDLQAANINGSMNITVNAGDVVKTLDEEHRSYDYLQKQDLSFVVGADGAAALSNGNLPSGLANAAFFPFGTLNNAKDTDYGYALVVTVDVTKLGYAKNTAYCFKANDEDFILSVSAAGELSKLESPTIASTETLLGEKSCAVPVVRYKTVTVGTNVVYWDIVGLTETEPHEWQGNECKKCHSIKYDVKVGDASYTLVAIPATKTVNNPDTDQDNWWASPTADTAVSGNFILHYTWTNIDPNYPGDGAIEIHDDNDKWFGYRTFEADYNPGASPLLATGNTEKTEHYKNGTKVDDVLADGVKPTSWLGTADVVVYRYGSVLVIDATLTLEDGTTTYRTVTTNDKFTTDAVYVHINGNHAWCENIKMSKGQAYTNYVVTGTSGKYDVSVLAADTDVENTDYNDAWWNYGEDGAPAGAKKFSGNFAVQYTWTNTRDPFWHQDVVIELINGVPGDSGRYLDINFTTNNPWGARWADAAKDGDKGLFDNGKNGSNTMTATKNGTAITAADFAETFKQGAKDDKNVDILGTEERWKGNYTLTIYRVENTYTIIQRIDAASGDVYIVTNVVTISVNGSLAVSNDTVVQLAGNSFWVDNIKVATGEVKAQSAT